MTATEMISAQRLSKSFGHKLVVDNLSLHILAGEIFGLVGPDGAGKTTTIRLLCGALRPDPLSRTSGGEAKGSGRVQADNLSIEESKHEVMSQDIEARIKIGDFDLIRETEKARSLIGYLPQRFSLYDDLTVLENLRFFAEVRGLPPTEWLPRCMEILKFVGLDEFIDRRAGQLSGGMKQKLGLAAALAHRPRILLLDEPTTGVDPVTRQDFWRLIIRLVSQKDGGESVTVLVSTPYMDEAVRCSRLGFMNNGRLMIEGTPSELRAILADRILELRGHPLGLIRRTAEKDEDVEDVQMFGDRIHLRIVTGKATSIEERLRKRVLEQGGEVESIRITQPQLEDVFISLIAPRRGTE